VKIEKYSVEGENSLPDLPRRGAVAFVNESDRKVWVTRVTGMLGAVGRIIDEIKWGEHRLIGREDYGKLKVVLLDDLKDNTSDGIKTVMLHWEGVYRERGYAFYNSNSSNGYKVSVIMFDGMFYLQLRREKRRPIVAGVFKSNLECERFIKKYYPEKCGIVVIYANNRLTREFHETPVHVGVHQGAS
jgi:hypothetical protein